jgi:hypothetical protein
LALLALASEAELPNSISRSLSYLREQLGPATTTSSLCWAILALTALGMLPEQPDRWLEAAYRRTLLRDQSPHKLALIALASQYELAPLVLLPARYRTPKLAK